jgi:hypothetical protein
MAHAHMAVLSIRMGWVVVFPRGVFPGVFPGVFSGGISGGVSGGGVAHESRSLCCQTIEHETRP